MGSTALLAALPSALVRLECERGTVGHGGRVGSGRGCCTGLRGGPAAALISVLLPCRLPAPSRTSGATGADGGPGGFSSDDGEGGVVVDGLVVQVRLGWVG